MYRSANHVTQFGTPLQTAERRTSSKHGKYLKVVFSSSRIIIGRHAFFYQFA